MRAGLRDPYTYQHLDSQIQSRFAWEPVAPDKEREFNWRDVVAGSHKKG